MQISNYERSKKGLPLYSVLKESTLFIPAEYDEIKDKK